MKQLYIHMLSKLFILFVICLHSCTCSKRPGETQKSLLLPEDMVSNSFAYKFKNSMIKYDYVNDSQVHDYSGNWDFDGDNIKNSLLFIGQGGAHLFYHLKVVLSAINEVYNYQWISTDLPLLESAEKLTSRDIDLFPKFVIADFNKDSLQDIYVNISDGHNIPAEAKKNGISTPQVVLSFNRKREKLEVYDYAILFSRK